MSEARNAPLFIVGEEVALVCKSTTKFNTDRIEILGVKYAKYIHKYTREELPEAWLYDVGYEVNFVESALRKLPPNKKTSWEDCVWSPNKIKETL